MPANIKDAAHDSRPLGALTVQGRARMTTFGSIIKYCPSAIIIHVLHPVAVGVDRVDYVIERHRKINAREGLSLTIAALRPSRHAGICGNEANPADRRFGPEQED